MENKLIILLFEAVFYGFCFTSLIVYILSLVKSKKFIHFNNTFFNYSIKIIKWIGIVYLIYHIGYFIYYYNFILNEEEYLSTKNRATGPYAWAYWMMLLRPIIFSSLTQLFWLKRFKKKSIFNFFLIFIIFIIILFSGSNFERFVIVVTSLHRDYLPNNWKLDKLWHQIPLITIASIIERIIIYSFLVFATWFISKKVITNRKS